jgi:hypothetical protein
VHLRYVFHPRQSDRDVVHRVNNAVVKT